MKKLLLAAVAVLSIGAASNSFAGGCGTSYVTVAQNYCAPVVTQHVVHQPVVHQKVITQVYKPVVIEKKIIVQQPCVQTIVRPCVQTYNVCAPVHYVRPVCHTPVSYCW